LCSRLLEFKLEHEKKKRSGCNDYGGFCSPNFLAQLKHCNTFEKVDLGGGLNSSYDHVSILNPDGSFLIKAYNTSVLNRGALFFPELLGGIFLREACFAQPSFYSDAKSDSCGVKRKNCQRVPYVLVASQHWNYEYGHFFAESLPRIIFHFFHLKRHYPEIKLHLSGYLNDKQEVDGRYWEVVLRILRLTGISAADIVFGPVLAEVAFLPREG